MQPKFTNGKICILIPFIIIMVASNSKEKCHFQLLWTCVSYLFLRKSLHYENKSVFAKAQIYFLDIFRLKLKIGIGLENEPLRLQIYCVLCIYNILVFVILCLKK